MNLSASWEGVSEALGEIRAIVEQRVPAGVVRAVNDTAFGVRGAWQREATRVFDRPVALTRNAVLVAKAGSGFSGAAAQFRAGRDASAVEARIYLRDDAFKGTPPVKYLFPQVQGGLRNAKRFERALRAAGVLPPGMVAVPGSAAKLDAHGNLSSGTITRILSQLRASPDALQNASSSARSRRSRKRGGAYFGVRERRGNLVPGVYERVQFAFGSAVRPILIFVDRASYRPRYHVFDIGQRYIDQHLPAKLDAELRREGLR